MITYFISLGNSNFSDVVVGELEQCEDISPRLLFCFYELSFLQLLLLLLLLCKWFTLFYELFFVIQVLLLYPDFLLG